MNKRRQKEVTLYWRDFPNGTSGAFAELETPCLCQSNVFMKVGLKPSLLHAGFKSVLTKELILWFVFN